MCWRPAVPLEQVAAGAEAGPAEPGGVCLDPDETCPCEGSRTQPGPLAASASVERTDSSTRGVSALERKNRGAGRRCFAPFHAHVARVVPSALRGLCRQRKLFVFPC